MAETSGPWDNSEFAQSEWRRLFGGVWPASIPHRSPEEEADGLVATGHPSNRTISVSPGRAIIQGHLYENTSTVVLGPTSTPGGGNQRIDYVVLRFDPSETEQDDRIKLAIVEGAQASNPVAPALTQNPNGVWEAPLYRFGPYGTGTTGAAPRSTMLVNMVPMQGGSTSSDVNDRAGLSKVAGAMFFNRDDGQWYHYSRAQDKYVPSAAPLTGNLSIRSGWSGSTGGRTPRWIRSRDGQVMLVGTITRTGSPVELPDTDHGLDITNAVPSSIRPTSSGRYGLIYARISVSSSSSSTLFREPVKLSLDPSTGRITLSKLQRDARWIRSSLVLDGFNWWVD